jgi:hypothetical protein
MFQARETVPPFKPRISSADRQRKTGKPSMCPNLEDSLINVSINRLLAIVFTVEPARGAATDSE